MPDAHADIVELDVTHETDSHVSHSQHRDATSPAGGAAPPVVTAPAEATPSSTARGPSAPGQSGRQLPGSARAAAGIGAAVEIVSDTIVNSPAAATPDTPQGAMLRAALEWVAADPHGIDATPGLDARERVANRSSAADAGINSEPMEIEARRTLGLSADMALAQLVRNVMPPTPSVSRVLPASDSRGGRRDFDWRHPRSRRRPGAIDHSTDRTKRGCPNTIVHGPLHHAFRVVAACASQDLTMALAHSGRAIGAVTRLLRDHLMRRGFEVSVGKPEEAATTNTDRQAQPVPVRDAVRSATCATTRFGPASRRHCGWSLNTCSPRSTPKRTATPPRRTNCWAAACRRCTS